MIDVAAPGFPEAGWVTWMAGRHFAPMHWGPVGRAVVVAPHPDDETLGCGGAMRQLSALGFTLDLVAVTDGEAALPGASARAARALGRRRREETRLALEELGVPIRRLCRLRLADGGLGDSEDNLASRLTGLLAGAAWCIAPWRGDGHPDHEVCGAAAARACAATATRLAEALIWTWHWSRPGDPRVPWDRGRVVGLDDATRAAKRRAIACYRTQVRRSSPRLPAVLPKHVLARFRRPQELLLT